jgi:PTS system nitrogen regulatory IIA component
MKLVELVRPTRVAANLRSTAKLDVLDELAGLLARDNGQAISASDYRRVLVERERLRSTGVGAGVAIPHGKVPGLDHLALAVGLSRAGVDFDSADGKPVHIFMALAAPTSATGDHLRALARVARLCNDAGFRERLMACETDAAAYELLVTADDEGT